MVWAVREWETGFEYGLVVGCERRDRAAASWEQNHGHRLDTAIRTQLMQILSP